MEYAHRLRHAFHDVQIEGENFPPSPLNAALSGLLQMVFMVGLMANLLGTYVLPTPIAEWITQNRGMCILLVLASNFMAGVRWQLVIMTFRATRDNSLRRLC